MKRFILILAFFLVSCGAPLVTTTTNNTPSVHIAPDAFQAPRATTAVAPTTLPAANPCTMPHGGADSLKVAAGDTIVVHNTYICRDYIVRIDSINPLRISTNETGVIIHQENDTMAYITDNNAPIEKCNPCPVDLEHPVLWVRTQDGITGDAFIFIDGTIENVGDQN